MFDGLSSSRFGDNEETFGGGCNVPPILIRVKSKSNTGCFYDVKICYRLLLFSQ